MRIILHATCCVQHIAVENERIAGLHVPLQDIETFGIAGDVGYFGSEVAVLGHLDEPAVTGFSDVAATLDARIEDNAPVVGAADNLQSQVLWGVIGAHPYPDHVVAPHPQVGRILVPGRGDDDTAILVENLVENELSGRCLHHPRGDLRYPADLQQSLERPAAQAGERFHEGLPPAVHIAGLGGAFARVVMGFLDTQQQQFTLLGRENVLQKNRPIALVLRYLRRCDIDRRGAGAGAMEWMRSLIVGPRSD